MSTPTNSFDAFLTSLFTGLFSPPKKPLPKTSPTVVPASASAPTKSSIGIVSKLPQTVTPNQPQASSATNKPPIAQATPQGVPASVSAVQNLQKNAQTLKTIRDSAAFLKNAPRLFDKGSGAYLLTAQLATQILRECGVPIPKEVELSVACCQLIAAGGAAVTASKATNASFKSVASPTAGAIAAAFYICQQTGLIRMEGMALMEANIVMDAMLVVSSYGTDVIADVKLCLDVYSAIDAAGKMAQYASDKQVAEALSGFRRIRLQKQSEIAAQNFNALMKGDMGMFAFTSQIARNSAELFPRFFPEISAFFPPTAVDALDVEFHNTQTIFGIPAGWGSASGHTEIVTSRAGNQMEMLKKWCDIFLDPCIQGYNNVLGEDIGSNINKLSLTSLAIMAMLPPYFSTVPEDFDPRGYLALWNLTPYDFYNDDCITWALNDPYSTYLVSDFEDTTTSGISLNGVDYLSQSDIAKKNNIAIRKQMKKGLAVANQTGDIAYLLKDPDTNRLIRDWGIVVDHGPTTFYKDSNGELKRLSGGPHPAQPIYPATDKSLLRNQLNLRNSLLNGNWRNIQNYFSILSMIEALSGDWKGFSPSVDKENELRAAVDRLQKELDTFKTTAIAMHINAQGQIQNMNSGGDISQAMTMQKYWQDKDDAANSDYDAASKRLQDASDELNQWISDAPKRASFDKAFADEFRKMVWNKYPQVVASQQAISQKYQEVMGKMVYRQMNQFAFANVAKILNVPIEKLVQVNKDDLKPDGPGVFTGV